MVEAHSRAQDWKLSERRVNLGQGLAFAIEGDQSPTGRVFGRVDSSRVRKSFAWKTILATITAWRHRKAYRRGGSLSPQACRSADVPSAEDADTENVGLFFHEGKARRNPILMRDAFAVSNRPGAVVECRLGACPSWR